MASKGAAVITRQVIYTQFFLASICTTGLSPNVLTQTNVHVKFQLQWTTTYPNTTYPNYHLSELKICRKLLVKPVIKYVYAVKYTGISSVQNFTLKLVYKHHRGVNFRFCPLPRSIPVIHDRCY